MKTVELCISRGFRQACSATKTVLAAGGVVLIPTESFYGLAVVPSDGPAVDRVFRMKGRPQGMALPVLCASWEQVDALVRVPPQHRERLDEIWPGPLTAIFEASRPLAAAHQDGSLAVRIPGLDPIRELLGEVGPVTGTSANRHDEAPCTHASQALKSLIENPDLVLDGGQTGGLAASTIVDLRSVPAEVLRQGPIVWSDSC